MAQQQVGYRLIAADGSAHGEWGGIWGQMPGIPNPLVLPGGLVQVHCASPDTPYEDIDGTTYSLQPLMMDAPIIAADQVTAEAQRRIDVAGKDALTNNILMGTPVPQPVSDLCKAIQAAGITLAAQTPIPADYISDAYWPG